MGINNPDWWAFGLSVLVAVGSLWGYNKNKALADKASKEAHEAKEFTYFANVRPWLVWYRRLQDHISQSERDGTNLYHFQVKNHGNLVANLLVRAASSKDEVKSSSETIIGRLDSDHDLQSQVGVVSLRTPNKLQQAFFSFEFDDKHGKRWREIYRLDKASGLSGPDYFVPVGHEEIPPQTLGPESISEPKG